MSTRSDHFKAYLHNRPRKIVFLALCFVIVCVFAQPLYRGFKVFRSDSLRKESQKLWDAGSYELSFNKAYTAYLLNPKDVDSLRNLADTALKLRIPKANEFWEGVVNSKDATESDWASAVDSSLLVGENAKAFDYLIRWEHSYEVGEVYKIRRARAYIAAGEYEMAKRVIDELVAVGISSKDVFWLHARYVQIFGSPKEKDELRGVAIGLSEGVDDLGLISLRYIMDSDDFELADRIEAADRFLNHPDRSEVDGLKSLSVLIQNDRYDRKLILGKMDTEFDLEDQKLLAALTTLLCEIEEYQYVLDLVDEFSSKKNPQVYRNYLIAELNRGEVDRVLDLTSQNDRRIASMAVESVLRAQIFQDSGINANYKKNLEESVNQAVYEDVLFLESQFRRLGEEAVLLQLYKKASDNSSYGMRAKRLYLDLAMRLKDEFALQNGIDGLVLEDISQNPFEQARWVYLSFLFGLNQEQSRQLAQELVAKFPANRSFQVNLAMAYQQQGDLERALPLVNIPLESILMLDLRSRLVVASILDASNYSELALLVAESIDPKMLLPREAIILDSI